MRWFSGLLGDFRQAFRVHRNSPGFTAVAVLSLALGIGANTAIFTLLNAIVLRELPVPHPSELVMFGAGRASGINGALPSRTPQLFSAPFYRHVQESNGVFQALAAEYSMAQRVYARFDAGTLEPFEARLVSGNYFSTLQSPAQIGRTLLNYDDQVPGSGAVAVISDSFWKKRFARDPSVVGRKFTAGNVVYTIVGVAAADFFGTKVGEYPDMWFPLSMLHQLVPWLNNLNDPMGQFAYLIGRLKPGISPQQAAPRVDASYHQFMWQAADATARARDNGSFARAHVELVSGARGFSYLRDQFALPLRILTAVAGMVLLIACANVANLLLARAVARRRELAVRVAIGAGRARLIQQLLAESLLLAFAGGAAGVLVATWGSHGLLRMISTGPVVVPLDIAPDVRVLSFTFAVTFATGIVFGLAPALRGTKLNPNASLKEGKGAAGAQRSSLGKLLVAGQITLSLVLLVGAGLFGRTIQNLTSVNTGFTQDKVLLIELDTDFSGYTESDTRLSGVYARITQKLRAVPGVHAAGMSLFSFGPAQWSTQIEPIGTKAERQSSNANVVTPNYFEAVGIPIVAGRDFRETDTAQSPNVAIVDETFARQFFPGGSVIGHKFKQSDLGVVEIIGITRSAKYVDLREEPKRMVYFPVYQQPSYIRQLQVRVAGNAAAIIPAVRDAVSEAEPNFPIASIVTMSESVSRTLLRERLTATLSTAFSGVALVLACIGLYGLLSYNVARRTGEIGIRMALGANAGSMIGMILRETIYLMLAGFAAGLPLALLSTQLIKSLLYGVQAADWFTIAAAVIVLLVCAIAAAWLPARRASTVDPMVALRYE